MQESKYSVSFIVYLRQRIDPPGGNRLSARTNSSQEELSDTGTPNEANVPAPPGAQLNTEGQDPVWRPY